MNIALRPSDSIIYTFTLGEKTYFSNGIPIEAHAYYCNSNEDCGSWVGKRNTAFIGELTPHRHFATLQDAIDMLAVWSQDPRYKSGFVKDFSTQTLYFENELVLKYFETRQDEACFFTRRIVIPQQTKNQT